MKLSGSKNFTAILAGCSIILIACLVIGSSDSEKVREERPFVSSVAMSPGVPASVSFCGKEIDLTRYDMYEGFDREISSFTYFHATTMLLFKRANRYFPVIEPVLKKEGVPDDFKYLAVIESLLDPRAVSPARAVGMWQMLEVTAKQYGLIVSPTVDERCHVEKATIAACRFLKDAYAKYGDWATAAASYNAGMGRISDELQKQQADQAFDLWLVEETSRYVFRIMAIKQIFEAPYKYGFVLRSSDLYQPIAYKEITVSADVADLAAFARKNGISYADLKRFNPWLRDRKLQTQGKTFVLKMPDEKEMYYTKPNAYVHHPEWVVE